ncbi:hypothetical protein ACFOLF_23405 [Paenibacillus sepulcri]|uniref:Uncharacterized protein n=1 Tax=Paenibacillus sepulcri TaxID=359917 RepID=A0ABS7C8K0_9BACL|nr:hypothetical protein [Paenibacillus sepulcri]
MINHPFFYEEQMKLHNRELKKIDSNAWMWIETKRKRSMRLLSSVIALIGLKSV